MKTPASFIPRQRKLLTLLPLLVLPFLALAFWALGGGSDAGNARRLAPGLNLQLPAPRLKENLQQGKLSLYDALNSTYKDTSPHFQSSDAREPGDYRAGDTASTTMLATSFPHPGMAPASPENHPLPGPGSPEAEIKERLSRLTALVTPRSGESKKRAPSAGTGETLRQDIDRLERLMQDMNRQPHSPDPEVQQVEGMLDRILDIQHPERVKARILHQSRENSRQVFPLQPLPTGPTVSILQAEQTDITKAHRDSLSTASHQPLPFQGWQEGHAPPVALGKSLRAVIHEEQQVSSGSIVRIRLLQDTYLGGRLLRSGALLHGTCRIQGERLLLTVSAAVVDNTILPVSLAAYDLDGIEGLYVPGSLRQQAVSQGTDRVISQGIPLPSVSNSAGAQAASAGIEAARHLFSRKARQVKVTLPAGHQLFLLDQQASF